MILRNRLLRAGSFLRPLPTTTTTTTTTTTNATTRKGLTSLLTARRHSRLLFSSFASNTTTCISNSTYHHRTFSGCSQSFFENESEFHTVADETLEDMQDAVESALEEYHANRNDDTTDDEEFELMYASAVLTMSFPPHGTWVLNKQTPNRQIWWSSPISGPRRYEYDAKTGEWMYTRSSDNSSSNNKNNGGDGNGIMTLTNAIKEELKQIYNIELDL
mmetsp:Transcript_64512/g.72257  ORF Transcript_64512/g.72257 Transcript_64512/m.72257 type:complete len:218 (-) Transcript_64512:240-893(-)